MCVENVVGRQYASGGRPSRLVSLLQQACASIMLLVFLVFRDRGRRVKGGRVTSCGFSRLSRRAELYRLQDAKFGADVRK